MEPQDNAVTSALRSSQEKVLRFGNQESQPLNNHAETADQSAIIPVQKNVCFQPQPFAVREEA